MNWHYVVVEDEPKLEQLTHKECADCGEKLPYSEFAKQNSTVWYQSCSSCRELFSTLGRVSRYRKIWNIFGMHCTYCRRIVSAKPNIVSKNYDWIAHIDHIVPRSKGGSDSLNNKQLLCLKCNVFVKSDMDESSLCKHLGKKFPGSLVSI